MPAQSNLEDSDRTPERSAVRLTMERTTQTERRVPRWRQLLYCLAGDDRYRRQRQVEAGDQPFFIFFNRKLLLKDVWLESTRGLLNRKKHVLI